MNYSFKETISRPSAFTRTVPVTSYSSLDADACCRKVKIAALPGMLVKKVKFPASIQFLSSYVEKNDVSRMKDLDTEPD